MPFEKTVHSLPWSAPSAAEVAEAAGASDLFVFRRIAAGRFAHVGGVGRGAGWAGIVEIGMEDEPLVRTAFSTGTVVRRSQPDPWHVLGPYYGRSIALSAVSADVFVLFGAEDDAIETVADEDLLALARFASEALVEVAPAKRLADELEALNAVRDLLHAPAESFEQALQRLVDQATASLSCDLGLLYIPERQRLVVCDRRAGVPIDRDDLLAPLQFIAERGTFPVCIQQAEIDDLPAPLSSADGVLAYYLLEVKQPQPGVLLLLHTTGGVARGFTLLCQSLGVRLVEAAEPLLAAALLRDTLNAELERAAADARRDPLTGLANRLAWNEALSSASARADSPASIVQVDCRGLKQINDTDGHGVGDQVLCRVAAALTASVRDGDLVSRLGGDEFAILLSDADEDVTRSIVERIETTLDRDLEGGPEIRLAIGAATSRDGNLEGAQREADARMLEAKRESH
ncbi:MAG: GGDEF domain-containing protein [Actinobacteria bacterium]|nr:MAG: GGDEF domain-containing protein [Actinomycetota bacterium]